MDSENINRAYLETLSFSDLSKIAVEYGVDVPDDLDRHFLIAELLELVEEFNTDKDENMEITSEKSSDFVPEFPKNFNETQISCILRNPAWAFVFWSISEADKLKLNNLPEYSLMLRICSLTSPEELIPEEAFEINIKDDSEQYVLLPAGKHYIKIELVYTTANTGKVLAFTPVVEIPQGAEILNSLQPGFAMNNNFTEAQKLSGIEKILADQYRNHRQSFSE